MILALLASVAMAKDIHVGVIDTGVAINKSISKHYVEFDVITDSHGTLVAGIIVNGGDVDKTPVCDRVVLHSCNFLIQGTIECLRRFKDYDYINMSLAGGPPIPTERELMKRFVTKGGIITQAAGNEGRDIEAEPVYPASYMYEPGFNSNLRVVSGGKYNYGRGVIIRDPNAVSVLPNGGISGISGSSASAPAYLHELLLERCAQP